VSGGLGQRRKTVTVLFADVIGSTSLGEQLDPESLREVMSRYFAEARAALERHGGTVEKFIGDAVMAVFGDPAVHEDDALRAVTAAVELRDRLTALSEDLVRERQVSLTVRTGVNTGEVVAGDAPGETLVTGDAVNVAARLEQVAQPGEILIGEATHRLVRDAVVADALSPLVLRGKAGQVGAFRLRSVHVGAPATGRRMDASLVGRDQELARLHEAFSAAVQDRACRGVTVIGAAGEGKTRLVAEFLPGVELRATVLQGRCLPYGEGITFWPVAEILRQVAGIVEGDGADEARRKLAKVAPEGSDAQRVVEGLSSVLGLGGGVADSREIFWSVRRLLETLAEERPVVAVVEDLHWAEPTLLDLLEYLAEFLADGPVVILGTARPELLDVRASWGSVPGLEAVRLHPLKEDESERLIAGLLGEAELPWEARRRITEAAEGNPLFVEEILRMLVDDGILRRPDGRWEVSGDLSALKLPPTIAALLAARLERLTGPERAVIGRCAVVGKEFWWDAIADLSPEEERPTVGAHLQALVRKELVRPMRGSVAGEDMFRFGHILVRDAAYGSLSKSERSRLHERLATWMEERYSDRLPEYDEIVGYHLEQAYRSRLEIGPETEAVRRLAARASERLAKAGRRVLAGVDVRGGATLLDRATSLLPSDDPTRVELLPELAEALAELGDLERAERLLSEAVKVAERLDDRRLLARARIRQIRLLVNLDPAVSFVKLLDEAREVTHVLEEFEDDDGLSLAWQVVGHFELDLGRLRAAERSLERAVSHGERAGDRHRVLAALSLLVVANDVTPVQQRASRLEEIVERAGGALTIQVRRLLQESSQNADGGRFDQARSLAAEADRIMAELGWEVSRVALSALHLASIDLQAGDPVAAEREARRGYEALRDMGETGRMSSRAALLALALCAQGRYDEAWDMADVADRAAAADDLEPRLLIGRARVKVLARRGELGAAEKLAREAVSTAEKTDWYWSKGDALMDLAEVLRLAGRAAEARPVLEQAQGVYEPMGHLVGRDRARSALEEMAAGS
jgi:class 3 adenylate cyclase/tetratricopeptide (TPR) repeat protein